MIKRLFGLTAIALIAACAQTAPEPVNKIHTSAFDENDALSKYEEAYAVAMERCLDLRGDERKVCLKAARQEARRSIGASSK
jgi:hypothetical protein